MRLLAESGTDVLSTIGLILNFGGVICFALWLSMVSGAYRGGYAAIPGIAAIACFSLSFVCFAADRPADEGPHLRV